MGGRFHQLTTSLCRFVRELCDERRPPGVIYRLGQHSSGHPSYVQLFNDYQAEQRYQCSRHLVREVCALVTHMRVGALQGSNRFLSVITTAFTAGNRTLRPPDFGMGFFVVSGVFNLGPIRQSGEGRQSHIKTGFFGRSRQSFRLTFDAQHSIPPSGLALDGDGFDLAFYWAMRLDFNGAYTLQPQFAVVEHFAAVAITGEGDAVIATDRAESRIAGLLTVLYATKERIESLINAAQHVLATREVGKSQIARGADIFQLIGLIAIVDRFVRDAIGVATLLNGGVVEAAGFGQLAIHRDNLSGGGIEPIFEVLLDNNPVSHCGLRIYRDAALVRLVTVFQYYFELFLLYYQRFTNERNLERGSARRLADAKFLCRL
jgi:hypothetical protein